MKLVYLNIQKLVQKFLKYLLLHKIKFINSPDMKFQLLSKNL